MNAYRGHLTTVVGDGPEVVIKLSGEMVRVLTPDGKVHTWPSEDVRVTGISGDRFWIAFAGEIAVFAPEEPESFMLEFLPGLKAARTVAEAIAASSPDDEDNRQSWTPDGGPRSAAASSFEPPSPGSPSQTRRHVAAHKPRLPQLSEHVKAHRNGHTEDPAPVEPAPTASYRRRWWSRSDDIEESQDADDRPPTSPPRLDPEDVTVDLTSEPIEEATISAAVGLSERKDDETADERSGLLRNLADRHQAFEAERRGTYNPRR